MYAIRSYYDTKLTLRLDDSVIERAKVYARNHKVSLSKMIETYLDSLTTQKHQAKNIIITPLVESLSVITSYSIHYTKLYEVLFCQL